VIPYRKRFTPLLRLGQSMGFLLPPSLKQKVPARQNPVAAHSRQHQRKILLLEGCVQPALSPDINSATIRLLDKLGIEAIVQADEKCCGGLHLHTDSMHSAREFMRNNIDQWWPHVENGIEAIISTASGCGVTIKDYGHLLKDDSAYADKAKKISSLTRDISEFIAEQDLNSIKVSKQYDAVAFHPPCTLQHGQKITGVIENILKQCGYQLTPVENSHLCCGSAGSYSLLQPTLSEQLGQQKIQTLEHGGPEIIATANIGCQVHLQAKTRLPVVHWITLIS
jgi:glycolate oxidase iron-sulfur subunit